MAPWRLVGSRPAVCRAGHRLTPSVHGAPVGTPSVEDAREESSRDPMEVLPAGVPNLCLSRSATTAAAAEKPPERLLGEPAAHGRVPVRKLCLSLTQTGPAAGQRPLL